MISACHHAWPAARTNTSMKCLISEAWPHRVATDAERVREGQREREREAGEGEGKNGGMPRETEKERLLRKLPRVGRARTQHASRKNFQKRGVPLAIYLIALIIFNCAVSDTRELTCLQLNWEGRESRGSRGAGSTSLPPPWSQQPRDEKRERARVSAGE